MAYIIACTATASLHSFSEWWTWKIIFLV